MTSVASILLLSVCAMSSASELIVQSETRTEDSSALRGSCPKDWELFDQRCFRFISTARTWAEAERFCLLLGGHLASVHSVAEYHFIQGLIVTQTHDSTASWIGGSDAQQNGIWFWSDGSRFTFTLWNPGEPNNGNGGEQCLHMNWGELIVQSKNTTDDSLAIQVYSGTCPVGWELYNQHCFRFISSLKTWDEAEEGFWFWSDGSRFAFTYWNSPIQPDNAGGAEHCLHMNAGGGLLWNDYPCSNALPSVCARS
ncbi:ladderlectin-like [Alosa alosa]|uniref:ladderlectin-like n=1 Tax=Alosa alosa TaxID=278164 RepID=UPI002015056F|nr:ladderlectin-like [Alosa alosa]